MKIYLNPFDYDEKDDCLVTEAHVDDVYFAVVVDLHGESIGICPFKSGNSIEEIMDTLGPYADDLIDYVAKLFGWEAA